MTKPEPIHVISLGAGVQSTTMALMAAHGEITPMPDAAIFADTQWEPEAVYEHLGWLSGRNMLPFPVYVVTAGNLREKVLSGQYSDVPFFTEQGMGRRQCTHQFKLRPIKKEIRTRFGATAKKPVTVWVGISKDEAWRAKQSSVKYIVNRHPLIEMNMGRGKCIEWLARYGYSAPRSACCGCPFRNKEDWRALRKSQKDWQQTIEDDKSIRNIRPVVTQYMHASMKPLGEIDFDSLEHAYPLNTQGE